MRFVEISRQGNIAILTMIRGKVHAINGPVIDDLSRAFETVAADDSVKGLILTGAGSFFSFGFDVPEMLTYSREECKLFLTKFTELYTKMFLFPKPVVAALNGHTIAGGCMLALTCDSRVIVPGKTRMSLNEITFGASVFAGAIAMLKYATGTANAQKIMYSGAMYSPDEALGLGLVDEISPDGELMSKAIEQLTEMTAKNTLTFDSVKRLMREPVADEMRRREEASIDDFIKIWYSESTWSQLRKIVIRD